MNPRNQESFRKRYFEARKMVGEGSYRDAFDLIVDSPTKTVKELFNKIGLLVDTGFILRDEKILKYGIYLLEKHKEEIIVVPEYAPLVFFNLANQYFNMAALYSYQDDYQQYYKRSELAGARDYYMKVLEQDSLSDDLKKKTLLRLGYIYLNSGRGLEALETFQQLVQADPDNPSAESQVRKADLMNRYASFNLDIKNILIKESWHILESATSADEEGRYSDEIKSMRAFSERELSPEERKVPEKYPKSTVEAKDDLEMFYIKFCVKHRLYINICSFCAKCDYVIGDRAVIDTRNLTLSGKGGRRYYRIASMLNRLKESYIAGRYLLVQALYEGLDLKYAELNFTTADIDSYNSSSLKTTLCKQSFIIGWEMLDQITRLIGFFLDGEDRENIKHERLWMANGEVRESVRTNRSPSLHALFDIYCDIFNGQYVFLKNIYHSLKNNDDENLPIPYSRDYEEKGLGGATIRLFKIIKTIILYLMCLVEEEGQPEKRISPVFTLHPFEIPEELTIN